MATCLIASFLIICGSYGHSYAQSHDSGNSGNNDEAYSAPNAGAPPRPDQKFEALDGLKSHLETQKQTKKSIQQQIKLTEKEIASVQEKLISIGREVQQTERQMTTLEQRVATLDAEKSRLQAQLQEDRKKTGQLAFALQRLSRIPTQALIARPGSPVETVHSGILLQSSIPLIQQKAIVLKENLDQLQDVTDQLANDRQNLIQARQHLVVKQDQLNAFLNERKSYYDQSLSEKQSVDKSIAQIALQAKSLSDLMRHIEEQEKIAAIEREKQARIAASAIIAKPDFAGKTLGTIDAGRPPAPTSSGKSTATSPAIYQQFGGDPRLPVSGIIQTSYGQVDEFGAQSRGLKIRTREDSLAVAPIKGVVKYAGEFGKFGYVVIIEHDSIYHSLVAGMSRLDVRTGQKILTGEPIGKMGSSLAGRKPILYYELRRNGEPVDPSVKFGSLG